MRQKDEAETAATSSIPASSEEEFTLDPDKQEKPNKAECLEQARTLLTEVLRDLAEPDEKLTWQNLGALHAKAQSGACYVREARLAALRESPRP